MVYATKEEIKAFIPEITDDTVATNLIVNATELINIDLGGSIETSSVVRRMDGLGGARLIMENKINSIVYVKQKIGLNERYDITVDYINGNIVFLNEPISKGIGNVEISYTKGYSTIPHDFKQFFLMYCKALFDVEQSKSVNNQNGKEIKTKSLESLSISYFSPSEMSNSEFGKKNQSFVIDYDKILKNYKNFNFYVC